MKRFFYTMIVMLTMMMTSPAIVHAQQQEAATEAKQEATKDTAAKAAEMDDDLAAMAATAKDSSATAAANATGVAPTDSLTADSEGGLHRALKTKFIEGNALFMSLVALALILGLAFCIERIIFLSLSDIDTKAFLKRWRTKIEEGDKAGAEEICQQTNGPVAAIAQHAMLHSDEEPADLERNIASFAETQVGKLEKGCSWITLFIAIAPSLGFLGTVIGMVMAFDQIQTEGDISPTIVASGMKVALITTIFGIIVAVVLQIFYNYILSRIEHLTSQMEQSAMEIMEVLKKH